jgi:hypothetical protein
MSHLIQYEPVAEGPPVTYASWYDEPVLLRFSTAHNHAVQTETRCTIISESETSVHIHIGQRGQNISKKLILAVEETEDTAESRRPQ